MSQLSSLILGKLFTALGEVLGESNWCLGWEEDVEVGRTVPSSSEQLDLLRCFAELCSAGQVFFSLLPGKQKRVQEERGFRTAACGESVVGL